MGILKEWENGICIIAVACAGLTILLPSGNMHRMVKLVISLCFLYALFSPLVKLVTSANGVKEYTFPKAQTKIDDSQQKVWEQSMAVFSEKLEEKALQYVSYNFEVSVQSAQIEVSFDMDAGEIEIESAKMILSDYAPGMDIAIKNALYDEFGVTFEVIRGQGSE